MDSLAKTTRKRVPNFTAEEKALLSQLIKKRPVIESKFTDGKTVAKKKVAWNSITEEFNCHPHVHKRHTLTLRRAWDNMKARYKSRATKRGNLIRTVDGPCSSPQQGDIVEEANPQLDYEKNKSFNSDGSALINCIYESQQIETDRSMDILDYDIVKDVKTEYPDEDPISGPQVHTTDKTEFEDTDHIATSTQSSVQSKQYVRKPPDYIRREAIVRIRNLEATKRLEIQILKVKLETEEIKKQAAEMILEKARLELDDVKKRLGNWNM